MADDRAQTAGVLLSMAERDERAEAAGAGPDAVAHAADVAGAGGRTRGEHTVCECAGAAYRLLGRAAAARFQAGADADRRARDAAAGNPGARRRGPGGGDHGGTTRRCLTWSSTGFSEGVQAEVSAPERALVEAVIALDKNPLTSPVSVTKLAERLKIDKAAASRRVRLALEDGYITNLEDRRGKPFRLKPGEPLPEEQIVLPSPDMLERETN